MPISSALPYPHAAGLGTSTRTLDKTSASPYASFNGVVAVAVTSTRPC